MIAVEIVYAEANGAVIKSLSLPIGATVAQALSTVEQDADLRGLNLGSAPVGIFGRIAQRDQVLQDGDRIEIYRPLTEDPKVARRMRALRTHAGPRNRPPAKNQ